MIMAARLHAKKIFTEIGYILNELWTKSQNYVRLASNWVSSGHVREKVNVWNELPAPENPIKKISVKSITF